MKISQQWFPWACGVKRMRTLCPKIQKTILIDRRSLHQSSRAIATTLDSTSMHWRAMLRPGFESNIETRYSSKCRVSLRKRWTRGKLMSHEDTSRQTASKTARENSRLFSTTTHVMQTAKLGAKNSDWFVTLGDDISVSITWAVRSHMQIMNSWKNLV